MLIEASAGKLAGRRRWSRNFRYRFLMPWTFGPHGTLVLEKNFGDFRGKAWAVAEPPCQRGERASNRKVAR